MDLTDLIIPGISVVIAVASWLSLNFWMKPVIRYLELKREIKSDLVTYGNVMDPPFISNEYLTNRRRERQDRNRHHAGELRAVKHELPFWFRWFLKLVKEKPAKASTALVGMSNANEVVDIENFLTMLKSALRLPLDYNS